MTDILLISFGFFVAILAITFLQMRCIKLKSENEQLKKIENAYENLLLEKIRLGEKCEQLKKFENQYAEISAKYIEAEKNRAVLAANIEQEKKSLEEKIKLLENAEARLTDTFKAISSDALSKNNQNFLHLAQSTFEQLQEKSKADLAVNTKSISELTTPIKDALSGVDIKLQELEKSRVGAYEALKQQVHDLIVTQNSLKTETGNLVSALRNPNSRGYWGEMQLRRVVELSGMVEHCDFQEQLFETTEDDKIYRPDMVINFPDNKYVIVDAKVPLSAYLQNIKSETEDRRKILLAEHVAQIKKQIEALSQKKYWSHFQSSPEFAIMFLPADVLYSIAIDFDPGLMEFAMNRKVLITTPTTLLATLHAISWGWKQNKIAANAKEIAELGRELYKRLSQLSSHLSDLGKSVKKVGDDYNSVIGNLERRVLVTARKFSELKSGDKEMEELKPVENNLKVLQTLHE